MVTKESGRMVLDVFAGRRIQQSNSRERGGGGGGALSCPRELHKGQCARTLTWNLAAGFLVGTLHISLIAGVEHLLGLAWDSVSQLLVKGQQLLCLYSTNISMSVSGTLAIEQPQSSSAPGSSRHRNWLCNLLQPDQGITMFAGHTPAQVRVAYCIMCCRTIKIPVQTEACPAGSIKNHPRTYVLLIACMVAIDALLWPFIPDLSRAAHESHMHSRFS